MAPPPAHPTTLHAVDELSTNAGTITIPTTSTPGSPPSSAAAALITRRTSFRLRKPRSSFAATSASSLGSLLRLDLLDLGPGAAPATVPPLLPVSPVVVDSTPVPDPILHVDDDHLPYTTAPRTLLRDPSPSAAPGPVDAKAQPEQPPHDAEAEMVEIYDLFFLYASVTAQSQVRYRQDRLLALLRARLGAPRVLLVDICVPEWKPARSTAIARLVTELPGGPAALWPVVVVQLRRIDATDVDVGDVDPFDSDAVLAAWNQGETDIAAAQGDDDSKPRPTLTTRTWISYMDIEEAMEASELDALLMLDGDDDVDVDADPEDEDGIGEGDKVGADRKDQVDNDSEKDEYLPPYAVGSGTTQDDGDPGPHSQSEKL
ncbi:hypothetical protein BC828DRAFT_416468 [Blastocladiella britannica]|nr:hypothetical protein BC828DRAFT_416468 [Blastocladiella britannica]